MPFIKLISKVRNKGFGNQVFEKKNAGNKTYPAIPKKKNRSSVVAASVSWFWGNFF